MNQNHKHQAKVSELMSEIDKGLVEGANRMNGALRVMLQAQSRAR